MSGPSDAQPGTDHTPGAVGARGNRSVRHPGRLVAAAVGTFLVVVAALLAWYEIQANPFGSPGRAVVIDVTPGESLGGVLGSLSHAGVIGSADAFRVWTFFHGAPVVRPGHYELRKNLPFAQVNAVIGAEPNVGAVVVVPGTTLAEISGELASLPSPLKGSFVDLVRSGTVRSPYAGATSSLEGLIGTGTYLVFPDESAHRLLASMVQRFSSQARAVGLSPTATVAGLRANQIVTVASIAQKEGYFVRYMGKVARVVYNRLASGMNLDMTSTVLYSLGRDGGPVTPADERVDTPYNTYLHPGLTPTPICVPSAAALSAALSPPPGSWLYFELVTAKQGTMVFSSTYTGQIAAEHAASSGAQK